MKIKDEFQVQEVMGEHLLVRQGQNTSDMTQLISLNATALVLWNEFQGKDFTEQDITNYLLEHYEVETERAAADAHNWVANLKNCKILADA